MPETRKEKKLIPRIISTGTRWWDYFNQGVWDDGRHTWSVAFIKTLNLSMRSFLNSQLWVRAASLTYNTVLAIVPALALVFAICRGFGFQNLLENELLHFFPAQSDAIATGLRFVDSYLSQSSEGVFVGAGIIFLLWTLYSLMSNVEDAFNNAWNVHQGRTFWRKLTDYLAIFFVLPVLMICSSGINIVMSTTLRTILPWDFLQGAISWLMDLLSLALIWTFFTGTYMLIPNTKVKLRYAIVAGIIAGTSFMVLQWVFVSGQVYVSRYNAIYGSFAFVPLLLIWLQLVWLITLAGAVVCYAMQNIYNISYLNKVENISIAYRERVAMAVIAVIVARFRDKEDAPTASTIAHDYQLPANLVSPIVTRLEHCDLIKRVIPRADYIEPGLVPAMPIATLTVAMVMEKLNADGDANFIPGFDKRFAGINEIMTKISTDISAVSTSTLVADLQIVKRKPLRVKKSKDHEETD